MLTISQRKALQSYRRPWPSPLRPIMKQVEKAGPDRLVFWGAVTAYVVALAWGV